ncbi:unnamed protein product [Caenorhabditis auriculariae]|uniref:G-protein coupled receptors family 1 profile domain-containing protein n=1 Tax=Caenorhabditis auriculariae TaxID=2777116 RepID=A0A8S1GRP2_9PELO|nr:unnamed protein product [Caenorhabditis auriculariae]
MYPGPIRCGPNSSSSFNDSYTAVAQFCVGNDYHTYFDGCANKCVRGLQIYSLSHYADPEAFIYGQVFPTLVLLAMFANVAVAMVLSKKHMITPTNVVLKYMAIAELLVGLVPLPWTLFYFTLGNYAKQERLELWWCYLQKYSMDAVPPVFHNIAMWLTVLLAAQRYVSISYPLHSRGACSVRNVRIATVIIAVISLLCGLPKSFDYYYETVDTWVYYDGTWSYVRSCASGQRALLLLTGETVFFNVYFWTRALGFILLPSTLLVILNVLLIRGIRKAQKRKLRLLREKRSEEAARQRDSNSTSLMLVAIVSIFLIVNLPQAAYMGILCVCETFSIRMSILDGMFPAVFLLASNMIVMATYPINFSIYCFMSSSFRQTFKAMFCSGISKEYERKRDVSAALSDRRSKYCTQLVNITENDPPTEISLRTRRSEAFVSACSNHLSPLAAV